DAQMPEMDGFSLARRIKEDSALSAATVMMLSSADRQGDAMRCRQLGIAAYLVKPVTPPDLFDAILKALGPAAWREEEAVPAAPAAPLAQPQRHWKILLAEDNAINQRLMVRLLEKRGCSVTVAADGWEALSAYQQDPGFDLVLMDIQMPRMGG